MAVMLITHDLGVIADTAQRVVVMYAGRVVEEASVRDLFANPRHPYTQGLLASIPTLEKGAGARKRLQAIPGVVPSLLDLPPGCRFSDRCPLAVPECRGAEPELRQVTPQHWARCIFA